MPTSVKLLSLLNLLCNTTQTTSTVLRDACYGCFFRAGNINVGGTQLAALNECAKLYIADTEYDECVNTLEPSKVPRTTQNSVGVCYPAYCSFAECVRRINAKMLIAACYGDIGNRTLEDDQDRFDLYINVTSCILAKTRCSPYNPITGEFRNHIYSQSTSLPSVSTSWFGGGDQPLIYNSLHVSNNGDIRIFTFPSNTAALANLFCSKSPNVQQSGFDGLNC